MALAAATLNAFLDALARNVSYANPAVYVKLHTGDPGAAGANNAAANTTRQQATFGAGASGGSIANTADVVWTNVSNTETYSHVSLWSAAAAGTYLGNQALAAAKAVTAGDNFRIATGSLIISGA